MPLRLPLCSAFLASATFALGCSCSEPPPPVAPPETADHGHDHGGHDHRDHPHDHSPVAAKDPLAAATRPAADPHAEAVRIEPASASGRRLADRDLPELFDELLAAVDEGQTPVELIQHLGDRGMAAGESAGELAAANLDRTARLAVLGDVLSLAGRQRRQHAELLLLYDPVAHDVFYGPDSVARQAKLGGAIAASAWPRELPAALVGAAPLPALDWLRTQSTSATPDVEKTRRLCRHWGQWIRQGNERQYAAEFGTVLASLTRNAPLAADAAAFADLVRAAGDARAEPALATVTEALSHADPAVRRQAATALGRFEKDSALEALVARTATESDPQTLAAIAAALGRWPGAPRAGAAATDLFRRSGDDQVRREVLLSAASARWPQRTALLKAAFDSPENGRLGVALLALADGVPPELRDATLALADDVGAGQPALVDAFGALADPRGVPYLVAALKNENSTPVRLKAALALEKVATPEAVAALLEALREETDPLLLEHLAGIAGNLGLADAEPTLIALAEDPTAPMAIRVQCLWSLGGRSSDPAKLAVARLSQDPRKAFGHADDPALAAADSERIELAELFLTMARLRQGSTAAEAELARQYADGAATTQLSTLLLLARLKRDHPVIAVGLTSNELPVQLGAVRAAGAADPRKYRPALVALRDSPWLQRLFASSVDTLSLRKDLTAALAQTQEPQP